MKIIDATGAYGLETFAHSGVHFSRQHPGGWAKWYSQEKGLWDRHSNFFFGQGGEAVAFLCLDGNRVAGRIAAFVNPSFEQSSAGTGLIGLFDCSGDYAVARSLLDRALDWLRGRGCTEASGPVDFSIWHQYRFMTKGFGSYAYLGEPRNPEYYPLFWEDYGFLTSHHWTTYVYDHKAVQELPVSLAGHGRLLEQAGYRIILMKDIPDLQLMKEVHRLIMPSYHTFPLYLSLSEKEFMSHFDYVPGLINKSTSYFIKDPVDEIIAFSIQYEDLNRAFWAMNGNTGILGKLRFFLHRQDTFMANIAQGGTLPKYSREAIERGRAFNGTALSLGRAGLAKALEYSAASGKYRQYAITLVRDEAMHRNYIPQDAIETREYALYRISI